MSYMTLNCWHWTTERIIVLPQTWTTEKVTWYRAIWTRYWTLILSTTIWLNCATLLQGKGHTFLVLFIERIHCRENSNSVCLILDAIEAWLLLKLSPTIWTILSNQIVTHFAKWLAGFKGGFKFTKFVN